MTFTSPLRASMGPQLVRCGMLRLCADCKVAYALQWGRNLFVAECAHRIHAIGIEADGFNGAATCSLRNDIHVITHMAGTRPLQWGRNLFVAE